MKQVLAAVLGAGLLLAGCGQSSTPAAVSAPGPYADGLDHNWTASTAEGQRIYGALSQGLKAQDFSIGLSITATNGYGPIELNTSNGEYLAEDGHPITLNGQAYSTGLGVHANSEIHVHATNLETPACTRFQADVGLDDEVGDKGSVVFQVFADGVKLFDSGVMTGASATQHIDVGIGNKSDLRFVVTDAGDNSFYDHADWAGAALSCAPTTPKLRLAAEQLDVYHLHSNNIKATFDNFPAGPVGLRLDLDPGQTYSDPPGFRGDDLTGPYFVADTTSVTLGGTNTENQDVQISAPRKLSFVNPNLSYHLVASVSGKDVASAPLTLTERAIKFTTSFDRVPTVQSGDSVTVVLTVTADPPLQSARALALQAPRLGGDDVVHVVSTGPVSGDGKTMQESITFIVGDAPEHLRGDRAASYGVQIEGVTAGDRDSLYGSDPSADFRYTLR